MTEAPDAEQDGGFDAEPDATSSGNTRQIKVTGMLFEELPVAFFCDLWVVC